MPGPPDRVWRNPGAGKAVESCRLDGDLLLGLLSFRLLREGYSEYTLLETRLDLVGVNLVGQAEIALERAEVTFVQIIFLLFLLLLLPLLALDR